MYRLLVRLMVMAALMDLAKAGISLSECTGKGCLKSVEAAQRAVLKVDWRPISVWPEEANRFK